MTDKDGENDKTRTPAFDPAARARIRSALISYMQSHDIGVPTLLARIAEATDRSPDLIPQKTLQRFLAGSHRTNDAFLIPLHRFAKDLPVPDAIDTDTLARALAGFYRPRPAPPGAAEARLAPGVLHVFERIPQGDTTEAVSLGELTIEPEDANGTIRVRERLLKSAAAPDPGSNDPPPHDHYEGIVVLLPPLLLAVMRSSLTRLPRIHWITQSPPLPLYSHCLEAVFHPAPLVDATMLRLEPQTEGR